MLFNKANDKQKMIYKTLSEIELAINETEIRKRVSAVIDKLYTIKPKAKNDGQLKQLNHYVKELKSELVNPIESIINNYLDKIDSILNQIKYEGE